MTGDGDYIISKLGRMCDFLTSGECPRSFISIIVKQRIAASVQVLQHLNIRGPRGEVRNERKDQVVEQLAPTLKTVILNLARTEP